MAVIDNDPGTEAERLSDWHDGEQYDLEDRELDRHIVQQTQAEKATQAATRYAFAKAAKTGLTISCGFCSRPFVKASYQQAFCCNKGSGNCKDAYWNRMNPRGIYA
jgi:hypothetical protein